MTTLEVLQAPIHMGPRRLGHANIFVGDLERSLDFYNRVCGLEIVLRQPPIRAGFVSNGNTHHDVGMIEATREVLMGEGGHRILAAGQGARPGLNHLGWEMESEFELVKAHQRATAAGYKIHRTVRHLSSHSVYIFDPDGNVHEFYSDVSLDWRQAYAHGSHHVSGEWTPGLKPPTLERKYHESPALRRVERAPLHPLHITHVVLVTRNFARMCDFFVNVAGLQEVYAEADGGMAAFRAPWGAYPFVIGILSEEDIEGRRCKGIHHLSFRLASDEDVESGADALRALGIGIVRSIDTAHKRSLFIRDPDGTLVEFYHARAPEIPFQELAASDVDFAI